ncbi:hypothetical protein BDR05DRAFT_948573 [Suillus weaverae]|nr:hypothetical protein BDR05DRAFT_948573 [Suillus weaverae]
MTCWCKMRVQNMWRVRIVIKIYQSSLIGKNPPDTSNMSETKYFVAAEVELDEPRVEVKLEEAGVDLEEVVVVVLHEVLASLAQRGFQVHPEGFLHKPSSMSRMEVHSSKLEDPEYWIDKAYWMHLGNIHLKLVKSQLRQKEQKRTDKRPPMGRPIEEHLEWWLHEYVEPTMKNITEPTENQFHCTRSASGNDIPSTGTSIRMFGTEYPEDIDKILGEVLGDLLQWEWLSHPGEVLGEQLMISSERVQQGTFAV